MLLIIKISLVINDVKQVVEFIFILIIRRNDKKVIYVSNVRFLKTFYKLKMNFIFEMNYDL